MADHACSLLLVEDDDGLAWPLGRFLEANGARVDRASSTAAALALLGDGHSCALVDVHLPDGNGIELVSQIRARQPGTTVIVFTSDDDLALVTRAVEAGATDYLQKPVDFGTLLAVLRGVDERNRKTAELARRLRTGSSPILGEHPAIERMRRDVALTAGRRDVCILIRGETGVGKDVLARALHELDGATGAMVDLNCAAISPSLFESELFGHEAGSFTGARGAKVGLLELADEGTMFLDEVGDLPMALQPKLLRAIEQRAFRRVGGTQLRGFAARVVSATHRSAGAMDDSHLRADLYYRLAGHVIEVPPLRARGEDILLLAEHFLRGASLVRGASGTSIAPETRGVLLGYGWPGNVRELRNVIERAALATSDGVVRPVHLPAALLEARSRPAREEAGPRIRPLADVEREHVEATFRQLGGNVAATARALGLSRTTLRERLRRFGLARGPEVDG